MVERLLLLLPGVRWRDEAARRAERILPNMVLLCCCYIIILPTNGKELANGSMKKIALRLIDVHKIKNAANLPANCRRYHPMTDDKIAQQNTCVKASGTHVIVASISRASHRSRASLLTSSSSCQSS